MKTRILLSLMVTTQLGCFKKVVYVPEPINGEVYALEVPKVRVYPPPPPVEVKPMPEKISGESSHGVWASYSEEGGGSAKPQPESKTIVIEVPKIVKVPQVVEVIKEVKGETVFAQHPPHFYQYEAADVAFIIGTPPQQDSKGKVLIPLEGVPTSESYTIVLKGDPINDFDISPASQTIGAPSEGAASFAYFSVTPKKSGPSKLVYYIQIKRNGRDAGIGIPKLERPINVEVNRRTWKHRIKALPWEGIITGIAGALGAWALTHVNAWWKKRQKAKKAPKE